MLLTPLLALLPLILASPVPEPEAKPYYPFYPASLGDKGLSVHARGEQSVYTPTALESRARLENEGRARLEMGAQQRSLKTKRGQGEGKRGQIKQVRKKKRQTNKCTAAPAPSSTKPSTNTPASSSAVVAPSPSPSSSTPKPVTYTVDPAGNGPFSGWGTYFDVGLSACGTWDTPGMPIVAVSAELFDNWPGAGDNPNNNPICGLHLDVTWGGKTLTVEVTDRCPGCAVRSLDMSKGVFEHFAPLEVGLLGMDSYTGNITWSWTSGTGRLPQVPWTP